MQQPAHILLKTHTATAHRRLDASPLLRGLLSPHLSLAHYSEVLGVFWAFHGCYEAKLAASCAWSDYGLAWAGREKRPLIERDLAALGLNPALLSASVAPVLDLSDPAEAFGLLYVLEGATLGGQMIAKHVAATLGLDAGHGAAYFNSYGPLTGVRWRETQAALDTFQARGGCVDAMIAAAQGAFAELQARFNLAR